MSVEIFIEYTQVYFTRRWKMKRQILLGLSVLMVGFMPFITNAERRMELLGVDPNVLKMTALGYDHRAKTLALKNKEAVLDAENYSWTDYKLWSHVPKDQDAINKLRNNPMIPFACKGLEEEAVRKFDRGSYFIISDEYKVKYFDKNSARVGKCECEFSMSEREYEHPSINCKVPVYYKSLIYRGK